MSKLRIAILLVLVVAMLPISASTSAQDKVTIRITTWAGVEESAEFQVIIDEVNANNDAFEIVYEPKPDDYYTVLQTTLAGGEAADLFWLDEPHMTWAWEGVLLDISDYIAADDRDAASPDDYFPGVWNPAALAGGVFGLPWIAQPVVLFYNKDIFDEMEMEYPNPDWTFDDFRAAAVALTNEDHYGIPLWNGWPPPEIWVWSFGGKYVSDDLTQAPVDSPEVIAALEHWASMAWNEECCPSEETMAEEGRNEMFKAGRAAMAMGGAADDLDRVEGLNVGVTLTPMGPTGERVTFAWAAHTVINADTEHPDEAYEALVQLTEGIHHWKMVSPRVSQANVEHLVASEPRKADNAEDIIAAIPYMKGWTLFPGFDEFMWPTWRDELVNPVGRGEETADVLAPDVRILLEDILASQ